MTTETKQWLYSFSAYKQENGIKKHYKIFLKKPNRKLKDAAEVFYSKTLFDYAKAGVPPRQVLEKILIDNGGIESIAEKEEFVSIRDRLNKLEIEYNEIILKAEKTEENNARLLEIMAETSELRSRLIRLELNKLNAFEHSADAKARNRTILWWLTQITWFAEEENEPRPLFNGKTDDERFDEYDNTMEDDEQIFWQNVLQRVSYLLTFWWMGSAVNEEGFLRADEMYSGGKQSEDNQEGVVAENAVPEQQQAFPENFETQQEPTQVSL